MLRSLSLAGALTAGFQNLDATSSIESDSYGRSVSYTLCRKRPLRSTAAIDALD